MFVVQRIYSNMFVVQRIYSNMFVVQHIYSNMFVVQRIYSNMFVVQCIYSNMFIVQCMCICSRISKYTERSNNFAFFCDNPVVCKTNLFLASPFTHGCKFNVPIIW